MLKLSFPKGFLWGASTAGHQVDGHTKSQWDVWEQSASQRLPAVTAKEFQNWPIWPGIAAKAAKPSTYVAGAGVDHYNRYETDFAILGELHMNAFRFSIEWSRIEPSEGEWDEAVVEHYRTYIRRLRALGIEPFVTLWHFTHPQWFEDLGGWTRRRNLRYFERYVQKLADELGVDFSFVVPLNEPNTYTVLSYLIGTWPPQRRSLTAAYQVYRNMTLAHRSAYRILKAANPAVQVGSCMAYSDNCHLTWSPLSRLIVAIENVVWTGWFQGRLKHYSDFLGINFYLTNYHNWYGAWQNPETPRSDYDWYMEPSGIARVLKTAYKKYRLPLYVTENGLADRHDTYRHWWLQETLQAMDAVLKDGVDLRGYLHWSLLDNFEWSAGWLMEFGLVSVDRTTMQRTLRPSARWFAEQIAGY